MICWNVNVTCVNLTLMICRMVMSVIYCNLWSGEQKIFYMQLICNEGNVVCHSEIYGCNLYRWSMSIVSCSGGGCNYPDVVTLNGLCMNHDDSSCDVCKIEVVIWIDLACPCLHGGVVNLIWHGSFYEV